MAESHDELLEIVLRECSAAGKNPWYPAQYVQATGVARGPLDSTLDQLRLAGLVRLTPWVQGQGQGYALTPEGAEVLQSPRLLGRLRSGDVPEVKQQPVQAAPERHALEESRGEKARQSLTNDARPIVTQTLLVLTIFWFLVGLWDYSGRLGGESWDYLNDTQARGDARLMVVYRDIGALSIVDVVDRHQWWRLLTMGFVHGGLLHLGFNMYWLFSVGPLLERMWGRAAFLTIYLVSVLGGSAVALLYVPTATTLGASGGLCGLLGSMATWLYLSRRHLPPHIVAAWRNSIATSVIFIIVISFLPGVSLAGHVGGGLTGAVISVPLYSARYGEGARRWLGWAGMAAITVVGLAIAYLQIGTVGRSVAMEEFRDRELVIERAAKKSARKNAVEKVDAAGRAEVVQANNKDIPFLFEPEAMARIAWTLQASILESSKRPEPAKAKEMQEKLAAMQTRLEKDADDVSKKGPFKQADLAALMKTAGEYLLASSKLSGSVAEVLSPEKPWPPTDLQKLRAQHSLVEQRHQVFKDAWGKVKEILRRP